MKPLNIILIIIIILVFAGLAFMAINVFRNQEVPRKQQNIAVPEVIPPFINIPKTVEYVPIDIYKDMPDSIDEEMKKEVEDISLAVLAYAKDNGKYPESDFKNPCSGVRFCLESADINKEGKTYLSPIPQVDLPRKLDYHYTADNQAGSYCVKTPFALKASRDMVFQCIQAGCGEVLFEERCE